jgi:hypothetical protein
MTNYTRALFQVSDFTAAPVILPVSSRFTDKTRIGTQSATRSFAVAHMMRRSAFDTRPHPMNIPPQSMKRLFH